jgi:hypothetical protein
MQWMLRRRSVPSRLHYGLRQESGRLTAHVWVTVDGQTVIGEEASNQEHSEVGVFPNL